MNDRLEAFKSALLSINAADARRLLAPGDGDSPLEIVETLIVPALESLGDEWHAGRASLSQVYLGGRLCEQLVDEFLPPSSEERTDQPRMAIATFEDYHLLGKRIVYSLLRASGYELIDYGRVDADGLVKRVQEDGVKLVLLSVLMLPSALSIKQLRPRLGPDVGIFVGGAPFRFDPELWKTIDVDGAGETAKDALELVRRWQERSP